MSSPEIVPSRVIGFDGSRATKSVRTGTETYSLELLRQLANLTDPGELRVYLNEASVPASLPAGPDYRPIPMHRLWTHARLSRELTTDPPALLFVPAHVIPPKHPKSVVTIHDIAFRITPDAFSLRERAELDGATRWNIRAAEAVIAVSRRTRDDLLEHFDIDPSQVFVVPHGVDPRFQPPAPECVTVLREQLGLSRPYLLAVGTLHQRKNFSNLIAAFEQLRDPLAELDLVIAGVDGPAASGLKARADSSKRRDCIRILGYVPGELLPSLFGGAELFILPSWYEGFGLPALEAMACGTPVLAASTGALAETCGTAAIFFAPHDSAEIAWSVEAVLGDSELKTTLAERGLDRAHQFTWERTGHMTLHVLRAVRDGRELTEGSLGWLGASHMFQQRETERDS